MAQPAFPYEDNAAKKFQFRYLKRYRDILFYAFLIFFLASGILVMNFLVADSGKKDGEVINIAGRQRMLSEKLSKTIGEIRISALTGKSYENQILELQDIYQEFNSVDNALREGGTVKTSDGKAITIEPLTDDSARAILKKVNGVWNGYKESVHLIIESKPELQDTLLAGSVETMGEELDSLALLQTANFAAGNSEVMLNMMETLTKRLADMASERVNTYQTIQVVGAVLLLILFMMSIWRVGTSLVSQEVEIEKYSKGLESLVVTRTAQLETAQADLVHINENLEQLVEIRTGELKESQAQLIQSEKMASLGQMVAGLAHEINTPLGFVLNNVCELHDVQKGLRQFLDRFVLTHNTMLNGSPADLEQVVVENESTVSALNMAFYEEADQLFDESKEGLNRIKDLVVDLKNFSRLDEAMMKEANLNDALDTTVKIAHNFLKHRVTVVKDYGQLPPVKCYPSQLNQVFLNLITNAAQACEKPDDPHAMGTLTLRTSQESDKVIIEVSDTGVGIAPEHLSRIFEPFFTTKPVGSGTGLGLSIVYKIIEQHGGKISVESAVGKGTTFRIELPLVVQVKRTKLFAEELANTSIHSN
jgi:two-component system, NtrC family, sensor kinase